MATKKIEEKNYLHLVKINKISSWQLAIESALILKNNNRKKLNYDWPTDKH